MWPGMVLWRLKLTHAPTGISVETDSTLMRNQREAKEKLTNLLRSRVYAATHGILKVEEVKATYNLPDDAKWNVEITDYRRDKF